MHHIPQQGDESAQRVIRLYGSYAVTHALGQVQKLEAMHCYAAADAWRATLHAGTGDSKRALDLVGVRLKPLRRDVMPVVHWPRA